MALCGITSSHTPAINSIFFVSPVTLTISPVWASLKRIQGSPALNQALSLSPKRQQWADHIVSCWNSFYSRNKYATQLDDRHKGRETKVKGVGTNRRRAMSYEVVKRRPRSGGGHIGNVSSLEKLAFQSRWTLSDPHTTFNKSGDGTNICQMKEETE